MKITVGIVFAFVLGFLTHFVFFGQPTTKHHWKVVERYNAYVTDPANYKPDAATGLSVTVPPGDPVPSLDALVAAGELSHVDLVLPTVLNNRDAAQQGMMFSQAHKEIVHITGIPSYTGYTPSGTQPLHLNLWFRGSDASVVQTLIR